MPNLDEQCSRYFTYRDLIECGKSWNDAASGGRPIDNVPKDPETWVGIARLASTILDPVTDHFGRPQLTYGFASPRLARKIARRIAPALDQHAGCERSRDGTLVCGRGGQAADFSIPGVSTLAVASWVATTLPFDRIYFYGADRPLHVSACQSPHGSIVLLEERGGRRFPRNVSVEQLVAMAAAS